MKKLLVMGVGNMLLTDDGIGVFAAQKLMEEEFPENVTVIEAGTFTQDIFYLFEGYETILVLDIVHAKGEPGTIYRLSESDLVDNPKQRLSIHDIDLIDSINMAELLHKKRPHLHIIGMEPEDYLTWNVGLSPKVQAKFDDYLNVARKEIATLVANF